MKKSLSGVDIRALIAEMPRGYIKKIGISDSKDIVIRIGDKNVIIRLNGWIYTSERDMNVRKIEKLRYLENRRIREVKQRGADRIVIFDSENIAIIVELFGGGNLVVTKDGVIEFAAKERRFKDRAVATGEPYVFPHESMDFFTMSFEEFSQVVRDEKYDAVRALAVKLGLGGEYAEELCARAGVEIEKKASDLSLEELDILYSALQSVKNFDGKGYTYYESDGSVVSVMPLESRLYEALEMKEHEDFSEAIEAYIELMGKSKDKKSAEIRKAEEELIRVEELIEESYASYGEIYETLAKGKEFQLHGFTFDPQKSVEQNMQVLYLTRKAMKEKIEGLKRAKRAEMEREKEKKERAHKHEAKKAWYERYWWFFTSENFLVIAGKNAGDNERIVKRYLTDKDFYVHADIHGGSSGVIKTYGKDPSEITFKEACCFVACFSKAWGSISSCDAYWVRAEQVSKSPPSGQFLSKGSFMIYGKKNYYRGLPMRLAVGVVRIDGDEKVMCAPESAISSRSKKYVIIVPGKKRAEQAAKEISEILGVEENEVANIPTRGVEIESAP